MTASVAIITRTKDRPRLLRRAIESVLNQSHQDWCHVIVNDGGDRSALEALLDDYRTRYQGRLHIVHHDTSRGMQVATNAGVAASDSVYLCVHDDDDSWDPAYLNTCVAFLETEGPESLYQGVITQTLEVREQIDAKGDPETIDRRPYIPLSEISLFRLGYENPFPPIAFCYRRTAYETIGPYDPRFSVAGDYDFNFRFLRRYEVGVINQALAYYHMRVGSSAGLSNSVVTGAGEHKKRYNEFKNHYLRGAHTDVNPALAVGLNAAKYLVELEWLAHEIRQRTEKIEGVSEVAADRIPAIEAQLSRSLELQDAAFNDLRIWIEDPRILDRLAVALKDLAYLGDITQTIAKRSEELAQQQDNRSNALAAQVATALSDLSYLNGVAQQLTARSEELARQQDNRSNALSAQIATALSDLSYLNEIAQQLTARSEELARQQDNRSNALSAQVATALSDLSYLNEIVQQLTARSEELARQQDNRSKALAAQVATALSDLSYLNGVAQQISSRAEEICRHQDARLCDLLNEMRLQHTTVMESQREKTLLQIGPIRLAWKKKRRKAASAE